MNNYEFCATYIKNWSAGKSINVLDYGCGAGQIVSKLRDVGIDAKGCDLFYGGGDRSKMVPEQLFGTVIRPMENGLIPFPAEGFDFVVNNQVLEHVEDLDHVLSEIHRVLKPGGQMLSLFSDKSVWREGHSGIPFLHWFSKGSKIRVYYAAFFRSLGFGNFKGTKSVWKWSQDFCEYLDRWTWHRSSADIRATFDKNFQNLIGIEDIWLKTRWPRKAAIFNWLPKQFAQWFVRKFGGWVFVCTKKETVLTFG